MLLLLLLRSDVTTSTCRCSELLHATQRISVEARSTMEERYLTVTIDRHGRGRTSASSSVLPRDDHDDDDVIHIPLTRSRHSVDCSGMMTSSRGMMTSSTQGATSPTSRSASRLFLGVPSELRRSSLQTDHHHHHHHHRHH